MIIVQGCEWVHVGMGEKKKLKIWRLDSTHAVFYYAKKQTNSKSTLTFLFETKINYRIMD